MAARRLGRHRGRRLSPSAMLTAATSSATGSASAMTALPHLNYSSYTWLLDPMSRRRSAARDRDRLLAAEPARRPTADPGPGLLAGRRPRRFAHGQRGRDPAQRGRRIRHRGLASCIPAASARCTSGRSRARGSTWRTDAVMRTATAKELRRVDPAVRTRRGPPALGVGHRRARPGTATHASGDSLVSTDFLAFVFPARSPGSVPMPASPRTTATRCASSVCSPAGTAIVDLSHRAVLTVSGPDRLSWLDSLTSQQLVDARSRRVQRDPRARPDRPDRVRHARPRRRRDTWLLLERDEAAELARLAHRR